jgi:archaellum component FlaC
MADPVDITLRGRRWKATLTPDELAQEVADLEQSMASLDFIKSQLHLAAAELGGLEAKLSRVREELESLDDKRREILAGVR